MGRALFVNACNQIRNNAQPPGHWCMRELGIPDFCFALATTRRKLCNPERERKREREGRKKRKTKTRKQRKTCRKRPELVICGVLRLKGPSLGPDVHAARLDRSVALGSAQYFLFFSLSLAYVETDLNDSERPQKSF